VFSDTRPVNLVLQSDGDLQMLCGDGHDATELPRVVGLNHLLERDPSLKEVLDLPDGWEAERAAPGQRWQRSQSPSEETES
jgi:hypothetical protein